jgi:hypothetical protein
MGTAMGSPMAPSYASLFMGKLEEDFLNSRTVKPTVWYRFLDDIFMIWDGSLNDLKTFINDLNAFHPNIQFTHTISENSVTFLDVIIQKGTNLDVVTNVFVKQTNDHQYLDYSSCHPKSCKDGIPFSQAKRYRRIISNDEDFKECLPLLRKFFIERNYPKNVINSAFNKVSSMSQEDAAQTFDRKK